MIMMTETDMSIQNIHMKTLHIALWTPLVLVMTTGVAANTGVANRNDSNAP